MTKMNYIKQEWAKGFDHMKKSRAFEKIQQQTITPEEYKRILTQTFHQVKEHPQALARLTSKFRGEKRAFVKEILRHSLSEVNHDLLALEDIKSLGYDNSNIPKQEPLPCTQAILGYLNQLIDGPIPIAMLGYLFHFEFTPTVTGNNVMESLKLAGIPEVAMTFISDHATIDISHNKLMAKYVEKLIETDEELKAVALAAKTSAVLYAHMLSDAIDTKLDEIFMN
jgi:pyrroloquinoline quinone (PQQ) biosynthesis protein C